MSIEHMVKFFIGTDLSGTDITRLTGRPPVLYSDLKNYKSINQLLGKFKFVIILYQTSSINNGHFVCLRENDDGQLSYSDSYGYHYDTEQSLGATFDTRFPKYLTMLIDKDGRDCVSNTYDYQRKSSQVATCGRYSSVFAIWRNLSFSEINDIFTQNSDAWLNGPDNLVVILTMLSLGNIREFYKGKSSFSLIPKN